jgi:hypothetical protein
VDVEWREWAHAELGALAAATRDLRCLRQAKRSQLPGTYLNEDMGPSLPSPGGQYLFSVLLDISSFLLTWKSDRIPFLSCLLWTGDSLSFASWKPEDQHQRIVKGLGRSGANSGWRPNAGVASLGKVRSWVAQKWPATAYGKSQEPNM